VTPDSGIWVNICHFLYQLSFTAGGDACNGGGEGKAGPRDGGVAELLFIGATLHLRGAERVAQPLVSSSGSVLVYNGNFLERDVMFLAILR
jgi:hypothetical protein